MRICSWGSKRPFTLNTETGEPYHPGGEGKLPCMIGHGEIRITNISLSDGKGFNLSKKDVLLDLKEAKQEGKQIRNSSR